MKKFEELVKIVSEIVPDEHWGKIKDLIPDIRMEIKPIYNVMINASEIRYRDFSITKSDGNYIACYLGYNTFGKDEGTAGKYLRSDNFKFENWRDKNIKSYLWGLNNLIKHIDGLYGEKYG